MEAKTQIVKIDAPELQGIEKSKAEQIKATFEPMVQMLEKFEGKVNEIIEKSKKEITSELTATAKRTRLDIAQVRIQTGKLKDEQKAEYLRASNAIQAVHNILVWAVTDKEDKLKEIENHFVIQEQKRIEALQRERSEKLSPYVEDADSRNLSGMDEDVWVAYFESKKKEHGDRIAAEKKAEEERIAKEKAEAEERERIRKENEQLKKEAEEREKQVKIEAEKRAKEERERQAKSEAERKEREEKERKERQIFEAKIRAEREEKEKIQRELEAKSEAERKAAESEKARIEDELNKGDAAKVKDLISDLETLKTKYTFKSVNNQKMYADVSALIDKIINHINKN